VLRRQLSVQEISKMAHEQRLCQWMSACSGHSILTNMLSLAGTALMALLPLSLVAQTTVGADTIIIFEAGSLVGPVGAVAAGFTEREGIHVRTESGGSLEQVRKLTVHGRIPDIIALADADVIPQLLVPAHARWYARFARNRMVLAYTDRSRGAAEMSDSTWWRVLTSPGVVAGRSDPDLDPGGYRTVMAARLAERYYQVPGLADRLLASSRLYSSLPGSPPPDSLLHAGAIDYAWIYESYALEHGLRLQHLPSEVDLGDASDSAIYATVSLRVPGATDRDTITVRGAPITYGLTIPDRAPNRAAAERFVSYMLSPEGRAAMRAAHLEVLDSPELVGDAPKVLLAIRR
jgi:molybdate/tungstate transport system substrate-binding protein